MSICLGIDMAKITENKLYFDFYFDFYFCSFDELIIKLSNFNRIELKSLFPCEIVWFFQF